MESALQLWVYTEEMYSIVQGYIHIHYTQSDANL
jgi:hypothetical protein